jgi:hypothetical protein
MNHQYSNIALHCSHCIRKDHMSCLHNSWNLESLGQRRPHVLCTYIQLMHLIIQHMIDYEQQSLPDCSRSTRPPQSAMRLPSTGSLGLWSWVSSRHSHPDGVTATVVAFLARAAFDISAINSAAVPQEVRPDNNASASATSHQQAERGVLLCSVHIRP